MNTNHIVSRIVSATKDSPIAVFDTTERGLYATFARTAATQSSIRTQTPHLIGVYFGKKGADIFIRDCVEQGVVK